MGRRRRPRMVTKRSKEQPVDLVIATDFSDNSQAAVRWGAFLARQLGSKATMVHVVDLAAGDNAWRILVETPEEIERSAVMESSERLRDFVDEAIGDVSEDVDFEVELGNPTDEILSFARTFDDPIIVVGTRGKSRFQEFFLGNTARRLVRQSESPAILVPPGAEVSTPRDLVVGVDFSDASREAVRRSALMARTYGASVHLVYGYVLPEVATFDGSMASIASETDELVDEKEQALAKMVRQVEADDVVETISAVQLPPAQAIVHEAEEREAQFIFVGSHGRRGVKRFFLGNTAERVMRNAPCPLFVVRAPESAQGEDGES